MRAALTACAIAGVLAALFLVHPHQTSGPPMRDFEAYYAAGQIWNEGGDPYSAQIWSAQRRLEGVHSNRYEVLPFAGPPALLPVLALIARLPFAAANDLWRAMLSLSIFALVVATLTAAGKRLTATTFVLAAIAALGFGPITSAFALGQIALPAFAFAVLAMRWRFSAILAWIQPNVGLATSGMRGFMPAMLAFAALCLALVGPQRLAEYADVVASHSAAERFALIQLTPAATVYGFGMRPDVAAAIGIALAVLTFAVWFARVRSMNDATLRFCGTCALLPFAMPFFHEHDLLVLFVPAIVLVLRADARLWGVAAAGGMLCATDWLGLAQRPDGVIQTLLLIFAYGCATIALRAEMRVRFLLVPAAACGLIALAGIAARRFTLPVWPDAMHRLPPNVAALPVSAAWHAELVSTGLYAHDAFSAALRLLSLLGCALLAYTAIAVENLVTAHPSEVPPQLGQSVRRYGRPLHSADC